MKVIRNILFILIALTIIFYAAVKLSYNYMYKNQIICSEDIECWEVENYDMLLSHTADIDSAMDEYGIPPEYEEVIIMQLMQESGADEEVLDSDPWQSSESLCGEVNCIDDANDSLKQAMSYHAKNIQLANKLGITDVNAIMQAYNFGSGFLRWMDENNYSTYNQEISYEFSVYQTEKDPSYASSCPFDPVEQKACYGDYKYVEHIESRYNKYQAYKQYKQEYASRYGE